MLEYVQLKEYLQTHNYSSVKIDDILTKLDNDPIHNYEAYMSEELGEEIIDEKEYKKYHCWFNSFDFEHYTYYLKEDLIDDKVETYLNARKLYEIK